MEKILLLIFQILTSKMKISMVTSFPEQFDVYTLKAGVYNALEFDES